MKIQVSSPKLLKREKMRRAIFDAVAELTRSIDYSDITVRMICTRAGISVGMFYRHFSGKDDVLAFLYETLEDKYQQEVRASLAGLPVEDRLIRYYTWLACTISDYGLEFARHFLNPANVSLKPDFSGNQTVIIGKRLLDKAVERGELTLPEGRDTLEVTHNILTIVKGALLDWSVTGGGYVLEAYVRTLLTRVVPALL